MSGRRWWLLIVLIETLIFCTIGYNLNSGRPSIPWALAGLGCGALTVLVIIRAQTSPKK
ncbi:hypothetical protein EES45_33300 [Streptomyces sp. ADI97-07]|uniref:hypothetical protein n=1 Tax=Streptomyces sp. ADI97-07 TaxID=1522762 RepID=UPI000F9338C6|nr:hypothetical protein [Streptomyces sp. ADI97-07]RPK72336.1 hypothetical protein EES45_33300 [Streptomyces sp. ADI97-07]